MHKEPFSKKQMEFLIHATKKWNIAHGSVRSGKTVGTLFAFMCAVDTTPGSKFYMVGYSSETIYQNAIRLIFENPEFSIFRPFCTWSPGKGELKYKDKTIKCLGARNEGAIGSFQGNTWTLGYCDEMTLYPESIIDMIETRLSEPNSRGFASMNPSHPDHKIKKWIDWASEGDPNYYALHFTLEDNPFLTDDYKHRIKKSLSGVFYKRNYLGLWCLAEGSIFDFFDKDVHVVNRPPTAAEYWICGVDYGVNNNFAAVLVGINTGRSTQLGISRWVEREYVWDSHEKGRQKTNSEYADDLQEFLEPYTLRGVYIDPSAASFRVELRRRGIATIDADNDVLSGITYMTSEMQKGSLLVCKGCKTLIKEIEGYVWDPKKSEKGEDAPLKKNDHCFTGDTLINSSDEEGSIVHVPIDEIQVGQMVQTREGFKRVLEKHCRTPKPVFEFDLHGVKIKCTSDHRVFTFNRDWVEISGLIQSDILCMGKSLWKRNQLNTSFGTEKNIDAIQILKTVITEDTSLEHSIISIETYGSSTEVPFQKGIIYITKTEIPLIMTFPICSVFQRNSISSCIREIFEKIILRINAEKRRRNGTDQNKEENGIEIMHSVLISEKTDLEISSASNVERVSQQKNCQTQDSVRITVSHNGEETITLTMLLETASDVIKSLSYTSIARDTIADVRIGMVHKGIENVYDLTIEDCHEYFANNILVHNCVDALRYCVFSHKVTPYQPYKHDPNDYQRNRFIR